VTEWLDREFDAFLDRAFAAELSRLPERATEIGSRVGYDRWSDQSDAGAREQHDAASANLRALDAFPDARLSPSARLSRRLFAYREQVKLDLFPHRFHWYAVNHMLATHNALPMALINTHVIADRADAEAYVARLRALPLAFDQALAGLAERAARSFLPPRLTFPRIIGSVEGLLRGAPFETGGPSPLLADFSRKLDGIALDPAVRAALLAACVAALETSVGPACRKFATSMRGYAARVPGDHGLGALPGGTDAYHAFLKRETTLDLSAEEIHAIGKAELARIQDEMRAIMGKIGFTGSLAEFFAWMRAEPRFYLPATPEGRADYLARTRAIVARIKARLPDLFGILPRAGLVVKPIDSFNEGSATTGFYTPPAADGSRPGWLEINLGNVAANPLYQMEALAHHEGYPGHHLQISIAQERTDLPLFRRHDFYNAYGEGWALYAEKLPKEIGCYEDSYADFGRLSMEAWRACRMIVDPAIHVMGWSRDETIRFMADNTAESLAHVGAEVDRYFAYPAQATSFGIGMREILRLRGVAEARLGGAFDLRRFHDLVLGNGNMPLAVLGELVEDWVGRGGIPA
jgi:uncharacterized protein (DUF885 family)